MNECPLKLKQVSDEKFKSISDEIFNNDDLTVII